MCLQSPFPSLSLEAHCSPSTEEKQMEQWIEELAGESVCVSLNIWFNAAVRSLKLCTPHLALCDHHSYLCNFICNVPSLHSAMIMVPQLRQQLQWDKLWLSPQAHFMCWFSTYFHKYFPFENQHPKTKPGFSLLPTKPSHSSLTPHAHREQSVPFWSRVPPGIFDNSYLVPFPVLAKDARSVAYTTNAVWTSSCLSFIKAFLILWWPKDC